MKKGSLEFATWGIVFLVIFICSISYFVKDVSLKGFMGVLTLALLIALALWQKHSHYRLPEAFIVMIYIFIFVAIGLGTYGGLYGIQGFDDVLHFLSGILSGYGAWFILLSFEGKNTVSRLSQKFIIFYIIMFVLAVAGFWELLEFAGDRYFHFTAQGRDHADTMFDMIDGFLGGIVFCIFYKYLMKKPSDSQFPEEE